MAFINTASVYFVLTVYTAACLEILRTPNVTLYEGEKATLSCGISWSSVEEKYVLWYTQKVWLVNILNELHLNLLGSRQNRFSLSVVKERNADGLLNLTSTISIVDVRQSDAGLYTCNIAETSTMSTIELKVVSVCLQNPTCNQVPISAIVDDLVTVSCMSAIGDQINELSLYIYNDRDQKQRLLEKRNYPDFTNFTLSFTYTISEGDTTLYFLCEGNGRNSQGPRSCVTNIMNVVPMITVNVLRLWREDERACFVCTITEGSLQSAEYSWSIHDHEKQLLGFPGSSQICIDEVDMESVDDQQ